MSVSYLLTYGTQKNTKWMCISCLSTDYIFSIIDVLWFDLKKKKKQASFVSYITLAIENMSLSMPQEIVKNREAWSAAVHGITKG